MKRIYYLTRSYFPDRSGGILMRMAAVDLMQKNGFDVTVVTPNYWDREVKAKNNILYIPFGHNLRLAMLFERLGIYEDYLDRWAAKVYEYLKDRVRKDDIIFATSGGELANIKLGSLLKTRVGCKYVVNFRDPIDYSLVNGRLIDRKFHVSREKQEAKYIQNADLIITSSQSNQMSLKKKYPHLVYKIVNNYFGYVKKIKLTDKNPSDKLRIAYAGIFSNLQSPEILTQIIKDLDKVELYFIGDHKKYKSIQSSLAKQKFLPFMPHSEFMDFMMQNIDVGFVSLTSDYLGACVPSKIYEYINLGLPVLGALPEGDALELINRQGYGIACRYNDFDALRNAVKQLKDNAKLQQFKENILKDRDSWCMEVRIKEVVRWLRNL